MLKIDMDLCSGCLKCVGVCPFAALSIRNGKPDLDADDLCIKCLHCAAACPKNAIHLDDREGTLPGELPKLPDNLPEIVESFLMNRRSYRNFKPDPVPKSILEHALHVSAWAPSAKNRHPARWLVISGENLLMHMMDHILKYVKETGLNAEILKVYERGHNVVIGNANTILLAYARTDSINPFVDTALALYNAELILQSQGLGTCWAGYLTRMCNVVPELKQMLKLPEGCQFYGSLMVGYPESEKYIHIPNRGILPDIQWLAPY